MSEPKNGQNQQQPPRQTKAEVVAKREQVRMLAMQIGYRAAARECGLSEDRVRQWAHRYGWSLPHKLARSEAALSPSVTQPIEAMQRIMSSMGDRTKLAMARTSQRAFEYCDNVTDAELHELPRAVALEKHGRNAALAHNWSQANANVAVQVNVPMLTEEERAQMQEIDRKLDAIAAKLRGLDGD